MKLHHTFKDAIDSAFRKMEHFSERVHTKNWQGIDISQKPEMQMYELLNHSFQVPLPSYSQAVGSDWKRLQEDILPNLPWADNHFQERVCGFPLNPGAEWENWPYAKSADTFRDANGQFNHNYMERYWPRHAGTQSGVLRKPPLLRPEDYYSDDPVNQGIRGIFGDLGDVVAQLIDDPYTRQAYLPVFFPEDTGAINGGRVPCTLGYHFIMRNGYLHLTYYIRSCDIVRHFRDDIYLTVLLQNWVINQCAKQSDLWKSVRPGLFTMHIISLHCFRNDYIALFGRG